MVKTTRGNVLSIRAPPHRELACGFNGVRATKPRLFGTVEIRSPSGDSIAAIYVSLALYCHENISYRPEGRSGLTTQKQNSTSIIGKELLLWQAPDGRSHEDVISMDLPFMLPFPTATNDVLPATLSASERVAIELIMERFDKIPLWGMYSVPQKLNPSSIDHIVEMEIHLPRTCYGPADLVLASVTLTGNPDWEAKVKKVRAEKLFMWVEQIVTYNLTTESASQRRVKKIAEQRVDFGGMKLLGVPLTQELSMPFPSPDLRDKAGLVNPLSGSGQFTTKCKLFQVEYTINVKATFKGAKDISTVIPIVASQYSLQDSKVMLENIESAVYEAAKVQVVSGLYGPAQITRKSDVGPGRGDRRRTVVLE